MSTSNANPDLEEESHADWSRIGSLDGLITLSLVMGLAWLAGRSVQEADWVDLALPVALLAAVAAVFGALLARLQLPDSTAHFVAMVTGIGTTLFLVLRQVPVPPDESGFGAAMRALLQATIDWYLGRDLDPTLESLLVTFLMGSILWLVGYLASWCLFRRGWVFVTVVLPGFLMLLSLANNDQSSAWLVISYGLISLLLMVRQNVRSRRTRWQSRGVATPQSIGTGLIFWGSLLAVLATLVGSAAPSSLSQQTLQPLVDDVGSRMSNAQESAQRWMEDVTGSGTSGQVPVSGSFAAFNDSFAVGGPLELSDTPQALVAADRPPYLTAQSYDAYSGRGWYSTVEETFESDGPNGRRYSPQMTFGPNQDVPLSSDVTTDRISEAMEITLLSPTYGRLLTVNTFNSASVSSSVQMSWIQLDGTVFDLATTSIDTLPRELQPIATLLEQAEFESTSFSDSVLEAEVLRQQAALQERFLEVTWTVGGDGQVSTLIVSGQLPVYDDVEAVFARSDVDAGSKYRTIASTSRASDEVLALAGSDYPTWVTDRYLALPDTVTPRTIDRALQVTAPFDNPLAKARALEEYVRTLMVYDESVTAPPEDADIVDYLLFERQRGYCEYSASAMTVMLRAAGIPARMVVGFAPGTYDDEEGAYLYRQRNAHAWTEAFFPGYGWIQFEPTPAFPISGGEFESTAEATAIDTPTVTPEVEVAATPDDATEVAPTAQPTLDDGTPAAPMPTEIPGSSDGSIPWIPVGLAAGGAALVAAAWYFWSKPLRGLAPGVGMYVRLRRLGALFGVRVGSSGTPREFGRAMAERLPEARPQIERIVKTYEVDQYGPEPAGSHQIEAASGAWNTIRRSIPRWLLPWRKDS